MLDAAHQPASSWHIARTGEETGTFSRIGPRIVRCDSGQYSEAAVGIVGVAALAQDFFHPVGPGGLIDANYGLPLRPPQHLFVGPLKGQHPSGQGNGQRREVATDGKPRQPPAREGVETARATRIGGVMSASDAPSQALGAGVNRVGGTAFSGTNRSPASRASLWAHTTHRPSTVTVLFEFFGQVRPGGRTSHEVRYQATSVAHGDLFCEVANRRVTLGRDSSTEIPDRGHRRPRRGAWCPVPFGTRPADVTGDPVCLWPMPRSR